MCLKSDTSSNPACRYIETTGGPRTRARARSEAASKPIRDLYSSRRSPRRARPYSGVEDDLLRDLMDQGLSWDEVGKSFGQRFAGRDLRSLQMRWSRSLKSTSPSLPTRYSNRKRSCPS